MYWHWIGLIWIYLTLRHTRPQQTPTCISLTLYQPVTLTLLTLHCPRRMVLQILSLGLFFYLWLCPVFFPFFFFFWLLFQCLWDGFWWLGWCVRRSVQYIKIHGNQFKDNFLQFSLKRWLDVTDFSQCCYLWICVLNILMQ